MGSAGAERALKRPGDFQRYLGSAVLVKLYRNQDGRKEFPGVLTGYDEATGDVTITVGKQEMTFAKKDISHRQKAMSALTIASKMHREATFFHTDVRYTKR